MCACHNLPRQRCLAVTGTGGAEKQVAFQHKTFTCNVFCCMHYSVACKLAWCMQVLWQQQTADNILQSPAETVRKSNLCVKMHGCMRPGCIFGWCSPCTWVIASDHWLLSECNVRLPSPRRSSAPKPSQGLVPVVSAVNPELHGRLAVCV